MEWIVSIEPFDFAILTGPAEKRTPIRHDDNLKTGQGKFVTPEKVKYQPIERPKQVKPVDNLRTGQGEFATPEKPKYQPADRPKQVKPTDNLTTGHGDFVVPEKSHPRGKKKLILFSIL